MKTFILMTTALAIVAGCTNNPHGAANRPAPAPRLSTGDIATNYSAYQKITREPVLVSWKLAVDCRSVTSQEMEAEQRKHGPHANTTVEIYMNDPAAEVFLKKGRAYPEGAVVVKQKAIQAHWDEQGKPVHPVRNGVGGMVKREPGYDPAHGDWEYFYFDDARKIESGRIESCVKCHDAAKAGDHVFGTWRSGFNGFE